MTNLFRVPDFVEGVIPELVSGKEALQAIFISYNQIGTYEDGLVETDKSGLRILVQNGHLNYSPFTMGALLSGDWNLMQMGVNSMHEQGQASQGGLDSKLASAELVPEGNAADVLAVVYAGLSAFSEALECARNIRKQFPLATVVILTCDCDLRRKDRTLLPLVSRGEINYVAVTEGCGGRQASGEIVRGLIAAWPATVSS